MKFKLFVKTDGGELARVTLPGKYKMAFIREFGTETLPSKWAFDYWLLHRTSVDTVTEIVGSTAMINN